MTEHPLIFSSASLSDLPIAVDILEGARDWLTSKGIDQWTFPFTPEWARSCLERQELFTVKTDSLTVGVFRLLDSDPLIWGEMPQDAVYIHSLAVRRDLEGNRLGRHILEWIENYAVLKGRSFLRLDCLAENTSLCSYYEIGGFMPGEVKDYRFGDFLYRAKLYEKRVAPNI